MEATARQIPNRMYFRIGDVADLVGVKPYVLRYWESEFTLVTPEKSKTGQRVYKKNDVENLMLIKHLLYKERYSIEGARNRIRELRKEKEIHSFKSEKILPTPKMDPEEEKARAQRLKTARGLTREIRALASSGVRDIFKY
jgi:DNA-binding transcriptional MerR regulator